MIYTIRPLLPNDAKIYDDFLRPRTAEAFFLRSNVRKAGLQYDGKPYQAEYLGAFRNNVLVGVCAYSWMNTILAYADDLDALPLLAQSILPLIQKRNGVLEAVLGLADQAKIVIRQLGIPKSEFRRNNVEGLYRLNANNLKPPDALYLPSHKVRAIEENDHNQIVAWRIAFNIEALNATPGPELTRRVEAEITMRRQLKELFLLEIDGKPVSFCGVDGGLPEAIMIGPLWTPPEYRGKGYAKAVVARAIQTFVNERPTLKEAVLFTANPAAERAYLAIGFERFADWHLALLKEDFKVIDSR